MNTNPSPQAPIAEKSCCGPECCPPTVETPVEAESQRIANELLTKANALKELVKTKYSEIALQSKEQNETSCCGAGGCGVPTEGGYVVMAEDYTTLDGYNPDADLGLGCGIPTDFAGLATGQTVLDLGSGAGNDAFVARSFVGEKGQVIGLDFAGPMLLKARANAAKLGFNNVSFVEGDIEQMPLPDALTDVIISNCVLNLVPNKAKAFAEMYRVLKPGGHFCVSDIVLARALPTAIQQAAELYAGCVSGAILEQEYIELIATAGFAGVDVPKRREIHIPAQILLQYIDKEQFADFRRQGGVIYSITVRGTKPLV